ncbi:uncharacterized protein CLUP02_12923 [Colletotrichum lupini]|uniref:Uncharacterized protein n=1 Tax=Colletotrichum lupini TaxID=145971 RepID=A0A9Q8T1C9_9PEZI|nr:uncharacterized protein CLUP02_12923 [Colletotrichum lupini]UQC87418.1 hypothetical protein CLUP02_12923 [Colletotrichum lupini]
MCLSSRLLEPFLSRTRCSSKSPLGSITHKWPRQRRSPTGQEHRQIPEELGAGLLLGLFTVAVFLVIAPGSANHEGFQSIYHSVEFSSSWHPVALSLCLIHRRDLMQGYIGVLWYSVITLSDCVRVCGTSGQSVWWLASSFSRHSYGYNRSTGMPFPKSLPASLAQKAGLGSCTSPQGYERTRHVPRNAQQRQPGLGSNRKRLTLPRLSIGSPPSPGLCLFGQAKEWTAMFSK